MSLPLLGAGHGGGSGGGVGFDPYFASVKLLMGFEGTNGSTTAPGITDESSVARGNATVVGTASISTAQFHIGTSSLLPGNGGLRFADSADWRLSAANSDAFTIECSVRLTSTSGTSVVMCQYNADGTYSWTLQANTGTISFGYSTIGTFASGTTINDVGALSTLTWYRLAVDKDATGKIRYYRDGVMIASTTPANSAFFDSSVTFGIGVTAGGGGPLVGNIDELRITKGVARYASDSGYTPAVAAFPRT